MTVDASAPRAGRYDDVPIEVRGRRWRAIPLLPSLSIVIVIVIVIMAIFAPVLSPHNPKLGELNDSLTPPVFLAGGSSNFPLGTDIQGRDQLSRILHGARLSLLVVAIVLVFKTILGVGLGVLAGFLGGIWDLVIMRVVDLLLSFPQFLMAILMAVVFGPSFTNVILIITLFIWPATARLVRGEVLALKSQEYVTLARCAGASNARIMLKHILPGVVPTVLVLTTLQVGAVILFEASLSYLGVGIPPPNPSWGNMIADGRGQLDSEPWLSVFPGLAIFFLVLSMNTLGDWLRDRLDPRLRIL